MLGNVKWTSSLFECRSWPFAASPRKQVYQKVYQVYRVFL